MEDKFKIKKQEEFIKHSILSNLLVQGVVCCGTPGCTFQAVIHGSVEIVTSTLNDMMLGHSIEGKKNDGNCHSSFNIDIKVHNIDEFSLSSKVNEVTGCPEIV